MRARLIPAQRRARILRIHKMRAIVAESDRRERQAKTLGRGRRRFKADPELLEYVQFKLIAEWGGPDATELGSTLSQVHYSTKIPKYLVPPSMIADSDPGAPWIWHWLRQGKLI